MVNSLNIISSKLRGLANFSNTLKTTLLACCMIVGNASTKKRLPKSGPSNSVSNLAKAASKLRRSNSLSNLGDRSTKAASKLRRSNSLSNLGVGLAKAASKSGGPLVASAARLGSQTLQTGQRFVDKNPELTEGGVKFAKDFAKEIVDDYVNDGNNFGSGQNCDCGPNREEQMY